MFYPPIVFLADSVRLIYYVLPSIVLANPVRLIYYVAPPTPPTHPPFWAMAETMWGLWGAEHYRVWINKATVFSRARKYHPSRFNTSYLPVWEVAETSWADGAIGGVKTVAVFIQLRITLWLKTKNGHPRDRAISFSGNSDYSILLCITPSPHRF